MLAWFKYGCSNIASMEKGYPLSINTPTTTPRLGPGSLSIGPKGTLLLLVYSESTVLVFCYAWTTNVLYSKNPIYLLSTPQDMACPHHIQVVPHRSN